MYIIMGNVLFAALLWGFYAYCGGDRQQVIPGIILGGACFITGMMMGVLGCRHPRKPKVKPVCADTPVPDFDNIGE